jgi:hypothetical protein
MGWYQILPVVEDALCQTIDDTGFVQVVRCHLHLYAVAYGKTDKPFAHLTGDVREHLMFIWQLYVKHRPGQNFGHDTFDIHQLFQKSFPFAWITNIM